MSGTNSQYYRSRILAVDNAIMFLKTLEKYLEGTPYDLSCVTSGSEALEFLDSTSVDLILLDVEMPGMNGYELAARIKQRGIRTPIIFVSANSDKEDMERATSAGAAGILQKPFRAGQLHEKIKEFIR